MVANRAFTLHEAIMLALENAPGQIRDWTRTAERRTALREYVMRWAHEYALKRGVILSDTDITSELDPIIERIRNSPRG